MANIPLSFPYYKKPSGSIPITQNGTVDVTDYASAVVNVPTGGGGGGAIQSGVNFIDYDGSVVQHYAKDEFLGISAMPSNPSHSGLVAQGWNWSLADAKAHVQKYGDLVIGQMYTTDTGETRIYIHIDEDTPQNRLTFYVRFTSSVANNVVIDWGDGTVETKGSTTATNYPHEYATGGDYVIKLKVNTGTISFVGVGTSSTSGQSIYGDRSNTHSYNRGRITQVEVGNGVTSIGDSAFYYCYSIASITIPDSVTSIGSYAFDYCCSLASITIPDGVTSISGSAFASCFSLTSVAIPYGVTSIGDSAFGSCYSLTSVTIPDSVTSIGGYSVFSGCYSLTSVTIPDGVTSIGGSAFGSCFSLTSVTIPDSVTSIGSSAFASCYGISEYHLLATTPPTLANKNAFNSIASDCKIYVPYSTDHSVLNAYKTATNWATYADHIFEEPHIYGVKWDYSNPSSVLTRINASAKFADPSPATSVDQIGSSPFDKLYPWSDMKRYNVLSDGTVIPDTDSRFDQTNIDTVVWIPPFYYKAVKDTENNTWTWEISPVEENGFSLHPGSGKYIGRYHTSGSASGVYTKSGILPYTNKSLKNYRTYSNSKTNGSGWRMLDFATWSAVQWLYLVEFADFDSQTVLGTGWDTGDMGAMGGTDAAVYHTIKVSKAHNQYRWIEDPYSNAREYIDGIINFGGLIYTAALNSYTGDRSQLPYTGISMGTSGLIKGFGFSYGNSWAFIPDETISGDYTQYVHDQFRTENSAERIGLIGGGAGAGGHGGMFHLALDKSATATNRGIGSRLIKDGNAPT